MHTTYKSAGAAEPTYGTHAYWAWAGLRYQRHLDAYPNEFWVLDGGVDENAKTCVDPIYYGAYGLPGLSVHVVSVPSNAWHVRAWLETQPRQDLDAAVNFKRDEARARQMEGIKAHELQAALTPSKPKE